MSPTKTFSRLVFLILLAATSMGTSQGALAGGLGVITHPSGAVMRTGYLVVRLASTEAALAERPELPAGLRLHSRLLDPLKTSVFGQRFVARSPVNVPALHRIEERLVRTLIVQYAGPVHPLHAAHVAMKDPRIDFAEPWYVGSVQAAPNDPRITDQQALTTIRMAQAWDVEQGNKNVIIGISDNGVDQSHEDLKGSIWVNTAEIPNNGVDDDANGVVDDYQGANFAWEEDGSTPGNTSNNSSNGHGTRVAGISSASTNNGLGIAGVAWNCSMFPMKTARTDGGGIVYGYQSLLYSAQMGFDIVNASWGIVKPFSPVDQDVVDYCLELGTLIVASAGNHGDGLSGAGWNLLNFPAAYNGVLGVGETSTDDVVQQGSGLGLNALVMAPGNRATSTVSGGGYSSAGNTGTSFASPFVAGVAALVKAHYPALSPRQIAALVRREADDIDSRNPGYAKVLSGRVNAERALTSVPFSAPGLRISGVTRRFPDGRVAERYDQGDTLDITYELTNDLGLAESVSGTLSIAADNAWSVSIRTATANAMDIPTGGKTTIGPFRLILNATTLRPCILALDLQASQNYASRELDNMHRASVMTTFENDELIFSVGDDGTFGYNNSTLSRQGVGFNWKEGYSLTSPGGFILSVGGSKALKAYDNVNNVSEFTVEKPFAGEDPDRSVMSDVGSAKNIGIRVHQRVTFPTLSSTVAVFSVVLENRSTSPLADVSAGYFLDWDIGYAGQNNTTRLAPEALPTSFRETGVAQAFERADVPASVICAAVTNHTAMVPQATGMMLWDRVDDADGFTDQDVIALLNSGTTIQTSLTGDACGSVGILFPGTLEGGETREFTIVIGVGATTEEAATAVREAILNPNDVHEDTAERLGLYPHPASTAVRIHHPASARGIRVLDVSGRELMNAIPSVGAEDTTLSVESLAHGAYVVVVETASSTIVQPLLVVRK